MQAQLKYLAGVLALSATAALGFVIGAQRPPARPPETSAALDALLPRLEALTARVDSLARVRPSPSTISAILSPDAVKATSVVGSTGARFAPENDEAPPQDTESDPPDLEKSDAAARNAHAVLERTVGTGTLTEEDAAALRGLLREVTGTDASLIRKQLAVAVNEGRVRPQRPLDLLL
jgi:hypothetical protein